jgi:hypothetical protein
MLRDRPAALLPEIFQETSARPIANWMTERYLCQFSRPPDARNVHQSNPFLAQSGQLVAREHTKPDPLLALPPVRPYTTDPSKVRRGRRRPWHYRTNTAARRASGVPGCMTRIYQVTHPGPLRQATARAGKRLSLRPLFPRCPRAARPSPLKIYGPDQMPMNDVRVKAASGPPCDPTYQ